MDSEVLLSIRNLTVEFQTVQGRALAVEDLSLDMRKGDTLALVGESGCGKSVTAHSILNLVPQPPGRRKSGEIRFMDVDLLSLGPEQIRQYRGNRISIIFQEPMSSLNPVFTIGDQIKEAILAHCDVSRSEARKRVLQLLGDVQIADAASRYHSYPHELSGGMRQRVLIAMALACSPLLLIADEPTTALDVTVQAQIIRLLRDLQQRYAMSILLISHDLSLVARIANRIAIMYAARIVETGSCSVLFSSPRHPYTLGLLDSMPGFRQGSKRLPTIQGGVPDATDYPSGCHFRPRCLFAAERCISEEPQLQQSGDDHFVACWEKDTVAVFQQQQHPPHEI